jgi:hypothetical protein
MNSYNDQSETKQCAQCGQPFTGHPSKTYCSDKCKLRAKHVRNKIKSPPPAQAGFGTQALYRMDMRRPATLHEFKFICETLQKVADDSRCRIGWPLPAGYEQPSDIAIIHRIALDQTKSYYEIVGDPEHILGDGITEIRDEITKEEYDKANENWYTNVFKARYKDIDQKILS